MDRFPELVVLFDNHMNYSRAVQVSVLVPLTLEVVVLSLLLQVRAEISARRVYVIFRTLGLRHLCVTDASNRSVLFLKIHRH